MPPGIEDNPDYRLRAIKAYGFKQDQSIEYHVQQGLESTADFLTDYLSEFPPPDRRSRRSRDKNSTTPPNPVRDWRFYKWYPNSAQGSQVASEHQQYLTKQYQDAKRAAARKSR